MQHGSVFSIKLSSPLQESTESFSTYFYQVMFKENACNDFTGLPYFLALFCDTTFSSGNNEEGGGSGGGGMLF